MKASLSIRFVLFLFILLYTHHSYSQEETFTVTQVGANNFLDTPWDLHYGPDDFLWVTERETGRVFRINPDSGAKDELVRVPNVYTDSRQDGLLGMALHEDILGDSPYVYLSYTQQIEGERKQKIVRYTYSISMGDGVLTEPVTLIENMPASNDHNSGRLVFGPDGKLYYSIGDQGGNQNRNYCNPILAQVLPTQEEVNQSDWQNYPGKILRLNTDGSIPDDNPIFNGVQSHIYSYGHRNPQGLVFGSNGILYSDEHGPNTDDEVNLIRGGKNYGWPIVVGFQDDQAYDYCNWSTAADCEGEDYSNGSCPADATLVEESSLVDTNYQEPLFSMFAVTDDYDYNNPACQNAYTCRPNVAPSSIDIYESDAIPSWTNSLLVVSLKRGKVYRLKLDEAGSAIVGDTTELFYTGNRYRDIAASPDGKTFYLITDQVGNITDQSGLNLISGVRNPGTIMKFSLAPPVSVASEATEGQLEVWPNPATTNLFVRLQANQGRNLRGELINAKGQVVNLPARLNPGVNEVQLRGLPAGAYILRVFAKDNTWTKRVVVVD
ncbi:glucose/sorbosone family PQQ-dependent dehydrogenase [Neolewinella persica]|uniref:glucose/sorbosone family PQQ-dependent dehydrogenase n=1 Tax=Neolewinella persica TaxID=70998 RepID=UPI00036D34AE|nr:glucose/sorbosone family PQQ-dependent dehydrogenase [Neolewinella persica]